MPIPKAPDERRHPGVTDVRHEHRRRRRGSPVRGRPPDPGLEGVEHRVAVREHVRMVPLDAGEDDHVGPVRVEVARVLVGLDDERAPGSPTCRCRHADPGQVSPAAARRRTHPGRCRQPRAHGPASRPWCSCRGCPPRRSGDVPTPRPRRPAARVPAGCPAARAAASSALSGSIAVRALVTASRSGAGTPVTWAGSCAARDHHARSIERLRVRRRSPRVAAVHVRAGPGSQQGGG